MVLKKVQAKERAGLEAAGEIGTPVVVQKEAPDTAKAAVAAKERAAKAKITKPKPKGIKNENRQTHGGKLQKTCGGPD